jgi:hypothetical protein
VYLSTVLTQHDRVIQVIWDSVFRLFESNLGRRVAS